MNLRIMAGSQGDSSNHRRISPSLQYGKDDYDDDLWEGFDYFLDRMRYHGMKAVVPLSNFWEWSGGFGVQMAWAHGGSSGYPTGFYGDQAAKEVYWSFVEKVLTRQNQYNGMLYSEDSTIMSWQLANEPRAGDCNTWQNWIKETADLI